MEDTTMTIDSVAEEVATAVAADPTVVMTEEEKTIAAYNAMIEEANTIAAEIIAKTNGNPLLLKKVINLLVDEKNQHLVAIEKKEKEFKSAEKAEAKKKALEKCKALGTVNIGDYILCKSGNHTVIGKVKKFTDAGRYTIELDEAFAKKIATGTRVIKSRSIAPTKVMRIFTSALPTSIPVGVGLSEDDVKTAMNYSPDSPTDEVLTDEVSTDEVSTDEVLTDEVLTDDDLEALGLTVED